jgi:hypothetical protein
MKTNDRIMTKQELANQAREESKRLAKEYHRGYIVAQQLLIQCANALEGTLSS